MYLNKFSYYYVNLMLLFLSFLITVSSQGGRGGGGGSGGSGSGSTYNRNGNNDDGPSYDEYISQSAGLGIAFGLFGEFILGCFDMCYHFEYT